MPITIAALGPLAQAVLPPPSGVAPQLGQQQIDIVVADTPNEALDAACPTVVLSTNLPLAVPAVDPQRHNPIGWRRHFKDRVAALGPLGLLPSGARAERLAKSTDIELIRHCHHVEDIGPFHANAIDRAGALVSLVATGALIHIVDNDPKLEELLGDELYGLLTTDIRGANLVNRELHSIRTRRIALRDHSEDGRTRQICRAAMVTPPEVPSVSVLLSTNRPKFVPWAVGNVAKQNYPRLELILALHGDDFHEEAINRSIAQLKCAVQVIRMSSQHPFPAVLNAASHAASGTLLTKMDDDDLYDADHIWDLVLAREYSGAHLLGKGAEIVYLQRSDQTVDRHSSQAEQYSANIAGGTLLIARDDLETIGGWGGAPPNVDKTLIDDVVQHGGVVYRTHGRGYVLIRHGQRHSWNAADQYFLDRAVSVHSGWHGSLGGFDVPAPSQIQTS